MQRSEDQEYNLAQSLTTMLDGDDVEFNGLEENDPRWEELGLLEFIEHVPNDIEEWVASLDDETFITLQDKMKEMGFLN